MDTNQTPIIPGNTDPWAGPVDPEAVARQLRRQKASTRPEPQDACGCWARDCAECGALRADGKRPAPGHIRRRALRVEAALQTAREKAPR